MIITNSAVIFIFNTATINHVCQDLLNDYMANAGEKPTPKLDSAIENMCRKTRDLRRQLRKAVVDHVSDSFLESGIPSHHLHDTNIVIHIFIMIILMIHQESP